MNPFETQVGGDHYKNMPIQPAEFIAKNGLGFFEGNAIAYLCRWKVKGGVQDLRKAIHCRLKMRPIGVALTAALLQVE